MPLQRNKLLTVLSALVSWFVPKEEHIAAAILVFYVIGVGGIGGGIGASIGASIGAGIGGNIGFIVGGLVGIVGGFVGAEVVVFLARRLRLVRVLISVVKKSLGHPSTTFSRLVATQVLQQKEVMFCFCLGLFAALGMMSNLSGWAVGLTAAAALWYLLDIAVIRFRRARGLYGTTEIEVLEAARYVIQSRRHGDGGGRFDSVFDEASRQAAAPDTINAAPEGARP